MAESSGDGQVGLENQRGKCCLLCSGFNGAENIVIAAEKEWEIRNFDFLNLLYTPQNNRVFWRALRNYELAYLLLGLIPASSVFIPLMFLPKELEQGWVEIGFTIFHVSVGLFPVSMLCNMDTIKHALGQPEGIADSIVLLVAFTLGIIYGEGFYILGTVGLFGCFLTAYFAPGYEVHVICNYLDPSMEAIPIYFKVGKRLVYIVLTTVILWGRAQIFLQVFTVRDEVLFTVREVDITVREIWLIFVDILYIRSGYITAGRALQKEDSLIVFAADGKLKV